MAKGGSFENEVGSKISLLWSCDERSDLCRRTEGSGGRFTRKRQSGEEGTSFQAGDLTFSNDIIKPFFQLFCLEMKTGYQKKRKTKDGIKETNWALLDVIDSQQKEPIFIQFINQCFGDAELSNREPMLIFRRNQRKSCVALRKMMYNKMKDFFGDNDYDTIQINIKQHGNIIVLGFANWCSWAREKLEAFVLSQRIVHGKEIKDESVQRESGSKKSKPKSVRNRKTDEPKKQI
jgi:hypothetical protein